jgi:hypothetical protein
MNGKSNLVGSLLPLRDANTLTLSSYFVIVLAGQILISKSGNDGLNLAALHVAAHMQLEHQFYFRLSEGDKDTFVRRGIFFIR